jgi:hypothetical protein
MKRYSLIPTFFLAALLYAGCCSSKTVFALPQKMVGEIMVVGNEPFTRLAVRAETGELYLINCNEEIRQSLLSHQGKLAELFYNELQKKSSGNELKIIKVNILSRQFY